MVENRSYTRSEVYDLVWSKPVESLQDVFGMSGRGIAKRCERFSIPVPIRGHWQKAAAGKPVRQPPLPVTPALRADTVVFAGFDAKSRKRRNELFAAKLSDGRAQWERQRDLIASRPAPQTDRSRRDVAKLMSVGIVPFHFLNGPQMRWTPEAEAGFLELVPGNRTGG